MSKFYVFYSLISFHRVTSESQRWTSSGSRSPMRYKLAFLSHRYLCCPGVEDDEHNCQLRVMVITGKHLGNMFPCRCTRCYIICVTWRTLIILLWSVWFCSSSNWNTNMSYWLPETSYLNDDIRCTICWSGWLRKLYFLSPVGETATCYLGNGMEPAGNQITKWNLP